MSRSELSPRERFLGREKEGQKGTEDRYSDGVVRKLENPVTCLMNEFRNVRIEDGQSEFQFRSEKQPLVSPGIFEYSYRTSVSPKSRVPESGM